MRQTSATVKDVGTHKDVVAIIQARMSSSRLPSKVLMDLGGRTVLARVVSRVRRAKLLDTVVVATTQKPVDDDIERECAKLGVGVFRGDEDNVLDRYYRTAGQIGSSVVVRITADCPAIDPGVTDDVIRAFLAERPDYASNALERTFPRGLDTEVMTFDALERAWQEATEPYQRAHVTPYIYENRGAFKLLSIRNEVDYSDYRWTLDTPEDLKLLQTVYRRFENRDDFTWQEVLGLFEREPALAEINGRVVQKSLREG